LQPLPPLPPFPAPPGGAPAIAEVQAPPARPLTAREVQAIRERREELSNQLQSAEGRRNRLSQRLDGAEGANRAGIEQRIKLLDERILQLEADIASTGRLLTSVPTETFSLTQPPPEFGPFVPGGPAGPAPMFGAFAAGLIVATVLGFIRRRLWRRPAPVVTPAGLPAESGQRFDRLEQAVDAIAIEVERISEGQRYVTRVLTEAQPAPALGAGERAAEPLRVPNRQAVRVRGEEA
jgi:hypothetical protein